MKLLSKKVNFKISSDGISKVETIRIGGVDQTILIQSENTKNPILFMLHGGPSMPVPGVSNRGADYALVTCTKELVKHFTLVFWDQRGTGKSYSKSISQETMHLEQFISDATEITNYLLERFQQSKLHLVAHSWGTVIGLSLISRYPEKFYSYTGISQIVDWVENDKICYQWLLKKAKENNDLKALKSLEAVGEPPYLDNFEQWAVMRKWLLKYKSMFYDAGDKGSATFVKALKIMLNSPDYSLVDIYNSMVRGFKLSYSDQMLHDLNHLSYIAGIPKINVPVLFVHGEKENHVWPELIQHYYDQLDAPSKQLFWAKKSSHTFHLDDAKEIEQLLINKLKEFTSIGGMMDED